MIPFREKPKVPVSERTKILRDLRSLYGKDLKNHFEKIVEILNSKTPVLVVECLNVISRSQNQDFLPHVEKILNSKDEPSVVKVHALQTIYDLKDADALSILKNFSEHENLGLELTAWILMYLIQKDLAHLEKIKALLEDDYDHYYLATLMMNTFDSYIDFENHPQVLELLQFAHNHANPDSDFFTDSQNLLNNIS
jgi:hypothetical protein